MKTYNVIYDVGQDVYILSSKKIFKSKIEKIRIIHGCPYIKGETMEQMDGIEIDYLVMVNEEIYPSGGHSFIYDWYKQDDVFLDKNELLNKII
jgi:hypothetical protein